MITNLFFDFDGTLADTSEGVVNGVQFAFDKAGIARTEHETISGLIGLPLANMFELLWNTKDETLIANGVKWFREYYAEHGVYEACLYEGTQEMLQRLKDCGYVLDIVSSKPVKFIEDISARLGIADYFTHVSGVGMVVRSLSKAERMKSFIEEYGLDAQSVVMVGDSTQDVVAANFNNVRCIGVTYGFGTKDDLVEAGAWKLAETPIEVAEILCKYNEEGI